MHINHFQVHGGGIYDRNRKKKKKRSDIRCIGWADHLNCDLHVSQERKQYEDKYIKILEHLLAVLLAGIAPGILNRTSSLV